MTNGDNLPEIREEICIVTDTVLSSLPAGFLGVNDAHEIQRVLFGKVVYQGYVIDAQLPGEGRALSLLVDCINKQVPLALVIDRSRNAPDRVALLCASSSYGALVLFTAPGRPPQPTLLLAAVSLSKEIQKRARVSLSDTVRGH